MTIIRQGDVTLIRAAALPGGTRERARTEVTLAEGESTGTAHLASGPVVEHVRDDGLEVRFLEVLADGGLLTHTGPGAHHDTLDVPPGIWEVRVAREQDFYEGVPRLVAD